MVNANTLTELHETMAERGFPGAIDLRLAFSGLDGVLHAMSNRGSRVDVLHVGKSRGPRALVTTLPDPFASGYIGEVRNYLPDDGYDDQRPAPSDWYVMTTEGHVARGLLKRGSPSLGRVSILQRVLVNDMTPIGHDPELDTRVLSAMGNGPSEGSAYKVHGKSNILWLPFIAAPQGAGTPAQA